MDSALVNSATARVWYAAGTHRLTMFTDAGKTAASPRPRAMRATMSAGSEIIAAGGVSAVNIDHHRTAAPRMTFPPYRFARAPLAAMKARYPTKNDDSTQPFAVSLQ